MISPHPALDAAAAAATEAWSAATGDRDRAWLLDAVADGADGTPTSRLDELVEASILRAIEPFALNVLSEEIGHVDNGSSTTIVIDPIDGTGNAAAGIPFAGFTAAIAVEERFVEGLTVWLDTGRRWWGHVDEPATRSTTGRTSADGAIISMIRPKRNLEAIGRLADRVDRIRVLGSSSIESALVADGVLDAFIDVGSDTHRIVDLAAAVVLVGQAGGVVVDVSGRPVEFTTEIDSRWSGVVAASRELADELIELARPAAATAQAGAAAPAESTR